MLRIMNAELSDNGLYTCVARTRLDEENATALLTVLGETGYRTQHQETGPRLGLNSQLLCSMCAADVPDAPAKLEISEIRSPRNISLSWVPGSDHNSSVTGNLEVLGVCYERCFVLL